MRRIIRYNLLVFAAAVMFAVGCADSSGPDLADRGGSSESQYDVVIPESAETFDLAEGLKANRPQEVVGESSKTASAENAVIEEGADSDSPNDYKGRAAEESSELTGEAPQPPNETVGDGETPKQNGRAPDGDDPDAPLIVAKQVEPQDAPLDNGREPDTKPIPEGQRVAVASESVEPDATQLGRDPDTKPGAEVPKPAKETPPARPAAPTRKTLADLSEAIQALDKDGDGQLGVYEWPREKLAEFKTLDADKDGFLTPAELVAGQKKATDAEAAKTEKEVTSSEEKAKNKAKEDATPKADDSAKQEDAKAPAADSTDKGEAKDESKEEKKEEKKEETPAASADGADSKDDSSADDQPKQGS